jgi:hypothetical protein
VAEIGAASFINGWRSCPPIFSSIVCRNWASVHSQGFRAKIAGMSNMLTYPAVARRAQHPWQGAQAELVAQPPARHERNDVGRVLRPVKTITPPVEPLAVSTAMEPAVALSGALAPFRNGRRSAPQASHLANPSRRGVISLPGAIK